MTDDTDERDATPNRRTVLRNAAAVGLPLLADPASAQEDRELVVRAAEDGTVNYTFRVSGSVERGPTADERDAVLGGTAVKGEVFDGREDSFRFTGELVNLRLDGPGKVFVDGELVRDTTADAGSDEDAGSLPNTITLEAENQRVAYQFRVAGSVEKGEAAGTLGVDTIEGNVVRGKVGGSIQGNEDPVDAYRYSGAIEIEDSDGPLTVTLDIGDADG